MPAHKQVSATDTTADGAASGPGLFATFYGPRDKIWVQLLHKQLYEHLSGKKNTPIPNSWSDLAKGVARLRRFDPPAPAGHDTTVIQLGLNAPPSDAASAWENMGRRLKDTLNTLNLPADGSEDTLWGYTLIYQAVSPLDVSANSVLEESLPAVRRLDSSEILQSLAYNEVSGGRLSLLSIPVRSEGLTAATVYRALSSSPDKEKALNEVLFGSRLLYLDLIAHKGYYMQRHYRDLQRNYDEGLNAFQKTIDQLLGELGQREETSSPQELARTYKAFVSCMAQLKRLGELEQQVEETNRLEDLARKRLGELEQQVEETSNLEDLAHRYKLFVRCVSQLKKYRISFDQQLANYNSWWTQMEGNKVVQYHYDHLQMAKQELELMVEKGRDELQVADTTMSMAQVQIDESQEIRHQRIEAWLAAAALALALAKIIDHNTAWALLKWFGLAIDQYSEASSILIETVTQLLIVGIFALLAGLVVNFVVNKFLGGRRRLGKRRNQSKRHKHHRLLSVEP